MAGSGAPARILWAVEKLDVKPSDQLLEVGCGSGVAAALVCERLHNGRITAIDRSARMIALARTRNRAHIAAGRAEFDLTSLADASFGRRRFSKVFAINVNLFWLDPAEELSVIRPLIRADGALYLFFEPPAGRRIRELADLATSGLTEHRFAVRRTIFSDGAPAKRVCVIAQAD
jgi:SAM-dependent methyltransferase